VFSFLRQAITVTLVSIRTIPQRLSSSLVAVVGIAGVVVVFVAVLSIGEGFKKTMTSAGRTDRGIGTIGIGAPAHLVVLRAGELVRPAADPKVARWSTDPRSRVPLLPDLTPGVELPHTLATIVGGRVVFDTGLFD